MEGSATLSFNKKSLLASKPWQFLITHLSRLYLGSILVLELVSQITKVIDKEKSYGSLLRLRRLYSGGRGLGSRDGLSRLDLLHDGNRSGNSFRGRHYKNRGKLELERYQINR